MKRQHSGRGERGPSPRVVSVAVAASCGPCGHLSAAAGGGHRGAERRGRPPDVLGPRGGGPADAGGMCSSVGAGCRRPGVQKKSLYICNVCCKTRKKKRLCLLKKILQRKKPRAVCTEFLLRGSGEESGSPWLTGGLPVGAQGGAWVMGPPWGPRPERTGVTPGCPGPVGEAGGPGSPRGRGWVCGQVCAGRS